MKYGWTFQAVAYSGTPPLLHRDLTRRKLRLRPAYLLCSDGVGLCRRRTTLVCTTELRRAAGAGCSGEGVDSHEQEFFYVLARLFFNLCVAVVGNLPDESVLLVD
jgi:hypothetical protein